MFEALDLDKDGFLSVNDFAKGSKKVNPDLCEADAIRLFVMIDSDCSGKLDYDQFLELLRKSNLEQHLKLPPVNRNKQGTLVVPSTEEKYFGQTMRKINAGKAQRDMDFLLAKNQHFSQELYETRIASSFP